MDKKLAKIGMIMVLTLALILSSLGVLSFGSAPSNEFDVGDKNEITAEAAPPPPVWSGNRESYAGGDGSYEYPYLIANGEQLAQLSLKTNTDKEYTSGKYFKLIADIDLGNRFWMPIGYTDKYCFRGKFNGDGHTISKISINSTHDYIGLFGYVMAFGEIYNLGITDSTISGKYSAGGIVGYNESGYIYNCYATDTVRVSCGSGNTEGAGGIIGHNDKGRIESCYSSAVTSGRCAGQIVGYFDGGIMRYCYSPSADDNLFGWLTGTQFIIEGVAYYAGNGNLTPWSDKVIIGGQTTLLGALNAFVAEKPKYRKPWVTVINGHPTFTRNVELNTPTITKTYDGTGKIYPISGIDSNLSGIVTYYYVNGAYTTTPPQDVGKYNVRIYRPENGYKVYDTTITNGLEIKAADVTLEWTPPPTLVYDGNVKVPEVKIASGIVGKDPCNVTAALTTSNNNVDVGEFTYTATLSNANYKIKALNEVSPKYKITPKAITNISVERERDFTTLFNQKLTVAECAEFIAKDDVTITFNTAEPAWGIYKGSEGKITGLNITGANKSNYTFTAADITAEITKTKLPDIIAMPEVEYNSTPQPPTVTFVKDVEPANYALSWEFKAPGETEFVPVIDTPDFHDAGEYKLTATGINDYYLVKTAIYKIKQKVVALTWQTAGAFPYTGNAVIPTVEFAVDDIISPDECEIINGLTNATMSNVTAGTFTFTATKLSNINYALPTTNLTSGIFTITKATDNEWTTPLSILSIYKGGKLEPIAVSKYGADTIIIRYYDSKKDGTIGNLLTAPPDTKKAGIFYVSAEVVETTSYNGLAETIVKFRIKTRPVDDGPVTSITQNDVFWTGVIIDLINKDDTVLKRECDFGTMPKNVLETIRDTDKTLDIEMMGENLYITSEKLKDLVFDKDEYTIEEIKAMLADKPKPTPPPKPVEPTPPEPACSVCGMCPTFLGICLWIWLAIVVTTTTIIVIIIVGKKKKEEELVDTIINENADNNVDETVNNNVENVDNNIENVNEPVDENVDNNVDNIDENVDENIDSNNDNNNDIK